MDLQNVLLLISSLLVTLVTAIAAKPSMTAERKRVIVVIASVVIGSITALVNGQIVGVPPEVVDWSIKVLTSIAFVGAGSQAAYLLFKDVLKSIESKVLGDSASTRTTTKKPKS